MQFQGVKSRRKIPALSKA